MKKINLLFCLVSLCMLVTAQEKRLSLGNSYSNEFSNFRKLPVPSLQEVVAKTNISSHSEANWYRYRGQKPQFSQNVITDEDGKILVFAVDGNIYNKDGILLGCNNFYAQEAYNQAGLEVLITIGGSPSAPPEPIDINCLPEGAGELIMFKEPGNCNKIRVIGGRYNFLDPIINTSSTIDYYTIDFETYTIDLEAMHSILGIKGKIDGSQLYPDSEGFDVHRLNTSEYYDYYECSQLSIALGPVLNSDGERYIFMNKCDASRVVKATVNGFQNPISNLQSSMFDGEGTLFNNGHYVSEMEVVQMPNNNYRTYSVMRSTVPNSTNDVANPSLSLPVVQIRDVKSNGIYDFSDNDPSTTQATFYVSDPSQITGNNTVGHSDAQIIGIEATDDGKHLWVMTSEPPYLYYGNTANLPGNEDNFDFNDSYALTPVNNFSPNSSFSPGQIERLSDGKFYFYNGRYPAISPGGQPAFNDHFYTIDDPTDPNTTISSFNSGQDYDIAVSTMYEGLHDTYNPGSEQHQIIFPDQVDYENIPDYEAISNTCCEETKAYEIDDLEITSSDSWSPSQNPFNENILDVNGVITVKTGTQLTLQDITLRFSSEGMIVVEEDATLLVNNSTLTSYTCENVMWQGIRVLGDPNGNPGDQGQIVVQSNSKIENAVLGIGSGIENQSNTYGGRITASNTTFENNQTDIYMYPTSGWNGNYYSNISDCHFTTTAPLKDQNLNYDTHIIMENLKLSGTINDCVFDTYNAGIRSGIESMGGVFKVDDCDFKNLEYGIYATGIFVMGGVKATNNTFNCYIGAYLAFLMSSEFTHNTFNVGYEPGMGFLQKAMGLELEYCTQYEVEENVFTDAVATYKQGLLVSNSNKYFIDDNNEIYNNDFTNLEIGAISFEENFDDSESDAGLQVRCNDFDNPNGIDIYVDGSDDAIHGMHDFQGECSDSPETPANNLFTRPASAIQGDFLQNPNTHSISYQYSDGGGVYPTEPLNYNIQLTNKTPCLSSPLIGGDGGFQPESSSNPSCPDAPYGTGNPGVVIGVINVQIAGLSDIIDGGDTDGLVDDINNTSNFNSIKNTLKNVAPYLSDEALIALIKNQQAPDYILRKVLVDNAPLTDDVWGTMMNRSIPLPDWVVKQVAQQHDHLSVNIQHYILDRATAFPEWLIKDIFVQNSPLTDEILIKLLNYYPALSDWAVKAIFVQNTPLSQNVSDAMYARIPVLANWVINSIEGSDVEAGTPNYFTSPISEREELTREIEALQREKNYWEGELIRSYLFSEDTTFDYRDSLKAFYSTQYTLTDLRKLADTYIANREYQQAKTILDIIATMKDGTLQDYADYRKEMCDRLINKNGCSYIDSCQNLKATLEALEVKQDDYLGEVKEAEMLLNFMQRERGGEDFVFPNFSGTLVAKMFSQSEQNSQMEEQDKVSIFPNPADQYTTLDLREALDKNPQIELYSISGQLINDSYQVINQYGLLKIETEHLSPGIYIVQLRNNNGTVNTLKFSVAH